MIVAGARQRLRDRVASGRRWLTRPIYVEVRIRAPIDDLWRRTQTPELHERWDLRFTDIDYLPRPDPSEPQRFIYATRIGFGLAIRGQGESVGRREVTSRRISALRFWSADPKSLIREGSGYWQYIQTEDGVRFLTRYGYDTRFGALGRWFDALVFRPLIGWATAWSFDRLRLWLERGIDPGDSLRWSVIHAVARVGLAGVWIYQGIVPKLLAPDSGELELLRSTGRFRGREEQALVLAGLGEIAFGVTMLRAWNRRQLFAVNTVLLLGLAAGAFASKRRMFVEPFNPAALTLAMVALSAAGQLAARDLPSARHCLRAAPVTKD